jgi:hypothetical protein
LNARSPSRNIWVKNSFHVQDKKIIFFLRHFILDPSSGWIQTLDLMISSRVLYLFVIADGPLDQNYDRGSLAEKE